MMSDNEKIVSRIDTLAKSKGTSIAEIERSVGFGNGKIGKWKKAPKSPPFESLLVVANYLETTIAYLTGETDDPSAGIKKDPEPEFGGVSLLSAAKKDAWAWLLEHDDETVKRFIKSAMITLGEDE